MDSKEKRKKRSSSRFQIGQDDGHNKERRWRVRQSRPEVIVRPRKSSERVERAFLEGVARHMDKV